MSGSGRLTIEAGQQRDRIETMLFLLRAALRDLDEVSIRSQQAIKRTPLVTDVLAPGLERLTTIQEYIRRAHELAADQWHDGNNHRWRYPDDQAE